ncbi:MAG: hypothetical protein HF973_05835 [Chloroflexi bacterium]|nr:hypothetical protein [Chloroflexota bacterium]
MKEIVLAVSIPIIVALTIWAVKEVFSPSLVLGILLFIFGLFGLYALAKGVGAKGCLIILVVGILITIVIGLLIT